LTVINRSVLERARPATRAELEGIPWLRVLEGADLQRAQTALRIAPAQTGDRICRFGRPPTFWFGVVDGLLKMSNDTPSGGTITYMGLPPGAWFGEGTLIKREPYRYNIEALRRSTVAGLPIEDFHALLDRSIPFNRYLMNQLNERLGHFIAAREIDRQDDPDSRVAGSLAQLFNPVLYPGVGGLLRITQQELGYLVGLSRQRVNQALNTLAAQGLIGIEYGGVRVRDLAALRALSVR
jgi:CRP/FNR family transcriptional regulator, cyclic AMP receptor protein